MTHSPIIANTQVTMAFPSAIQAVIDGKKITKLEWGNEEFYGVFTNNTLMLHKPDDKFYQWIINDGDLFGTDWIILD